MEIRSLKKKKNYRKYLKLNSNLNNDLLTSISYDLQTGSYLKLHKYNLLYNKKIYQENFLKLFKIIKNKKIKTILDFGTGECTKMHYLINNFDVKLKRIDFCDTSLSRINFGKNFITNSLKKKKIKYNFFCNSDKLPYKANSIDCIFAAGVFENIEPKRCKIILKEFLRVSKKAIFLIEPNYRLKSNIKRAKRFHLYLHNFKNYFMNFKVKHHKSEWKKFSPEKMTNDLNYFFFKKKKGNQPKFFDLKSKNYFTQNKEMLFIKSSGKIIPTFNNIALFRDINLLKLIEV